MANYQSIQRRFNPVRSSINASYIDSVLTRQQNTIDKNFGLLQSNIEKVLGQDLAREKDKEYLKNKVTDVLNTLDANSSIKFDSKKSRFTIQDALSDAAKDPEVLKQIANTKKVRQVQKFYQDRLKKGDLNQQNFQYAYNKSGIADYLNPDSNSDSIGEFKYLEYTDVDAKLAKSAKELKSASPNELISVQDPITGKTISKKVSTISPEEMRNYLRAQLNANDLKQLEIDGAMMYGMNDAAAASYRDTVITNSNKKYAQKITMLENYRDNGNKTKSQIADINRQIEYLNQDKTAFERNLLNRKTAEAIGGNQLIENKLDLYSNLYTKNGPESIKYDSKALKRLRDTNATANLNQGSNPNISTITTPTDLPETVNPYKESMTRIDKELRQNSDYLQQQFNNLNDNQKQLVQDTMENIKNDPSFLAMYAGQPISNEALQLETINRLGANFFPPDVAKELRSRISSTQSIQSAIENTTNDFVKTKMLGQEVFDQLYKEETALTMATPAGDLNIQQFLKDNGVRDFESYKSFINSDSKEAKQLRATIALQSMSLTNDITSDDITTVSVPGSLIPIPAITGSNKIDLSESEYQIMRQAAHDLTGEDLGQTYAVSKEGENYRLLLKNPSTNFNKIVNRTNELYQEGRISIGDIGSYGLTNVFGAIDTDRTARNESTLRNLFSSDNYKEYVTENLRYIDNTVAGSNSIRIKGDSKKNVDPVYDEILQYVDNATFDKRLPIDIYKSENGELIVTQTVKQKTVNNKGKVAQQAEYIRGTIQANDVSKMKRFNNEINLIQSNNTFKSLEDVSGSITGFTFIGDNRSQVEGLNRLYDKNNKGENMFRLLSAEDTARDIIFNPSNSRYINSSTQGLEIKQQFEDFVNNTQNYKLDFIKGVDSDYQVLIKDNDNNKIGSIPLNSNIPLDTFTKAYQGTPQVFLAMWTKSRVDKYIKSLINGRR